MSDQNILSPAAVRMMLTYPFWCEVYYSMTVVECDENERQQITTAATDGRSLWVNPDFWKLLSLPDQVFVVAHELSHKILLHPSRIGNRDPQMWNKAADYVVNAMLVENGMKMLTPNAFLPGGALYEAKYAGWTTEAVYNDLQKRKQDGDASAGQLGQGQADIVKHVATPEEIEVHEQEVKALVERAIANAKAIGKLPAGIEQGIVEAYKAPKEMWYNALHRYMQSLSISQYNWVRLNRRTLRTHRCFTPLHYSDALGEVALFIDTSGSCFQKAQQANFAGHLNAILAEAKPQKVHLYYFDAKVYAGMEISAGELDITTAPKGGGGTDFRPIFDRIEEDGLDPEVCIILTDLEGPFPDQEPEYPVVWASTEDHRAPFGETIYIEN